MHRQNSHCFWLRSCKGKKCYAQPSLSQVDRRTCLTPAIGERGAGPSLHSFRICSNSIPLVQTQQRTMCLVSKPAFPNPQHQHHAPALYAKLALKREDSGSTTTTEDTATADPHFCATTATLEESGSGSEEATESSRTPRAHQSSNVYDCFDDDDKARLSPKSKDGSTTSRQSMPCDCKMSPCCTTPPPPRYDDMAMLEPPSTPRAMRRLIQFHFTAELCLPML